METVIPALKIEQPAKNELTENSTSTPFRSASFLKSPDAPFALAYSSRSCLRCGLELSQMPIRTLWVILIAEPINHRADEELRVRPTMVKT